MTRVAFIICYDNELYFRECVEYISWLRVPDGVETDVVGVLDAESMASGYNAAMHETDARYKVYLQQNVFIVYENFIEDMIRIFEQNPEYGMLGVMGSTRTIADANYYLQWNTGMAILDDSMHSEKVIKDNPVNLCEAAAVDGMIMITQYDVEWREDIFTGFDFYDISQCMEFRKAGYKVGIPHQEKVWCNHIPAFVNLDRYDFYRKCFCEEYQESGYHFAPSAQIEDYYKKNKEIQEIMSLIEYSLKEGNWEYAADIINRNVILFPYHIQMYSLYVITGIVQIERRHGIKNKFYSNVMSVSALLEKYAAYKFLLKRLEYGKSVETCNGLLNTIAEYGTAGLEAEKLIAVHAVVKDEQAVWKLKRILGRICDRTFHAGYDDKVFIMPREETFEEIRNICANLRKIICRLLSVEETAYRKEHQQIAELLFETMENIIYRSHIGRINEDLYMAYLDAAEDCKKVALFAEKSQSWINSILRYTDREDRQPLVSVLLSVYNGGAFIEDTLRSIMNQSYQNLEIIVADDCSSDDSRAVIDRLAQSDSRIKKLYLKENSNVCNAINMCYKTASGKYIAPIGHDDIWKTDKIEKQVSFMEMYPDYAVCFTLVDIIDDEKMICNEKAANLYAIFNQKNRSRKEWVKTLLYVQNVLCAPSALIRSDCIKGEYIYHFGIVQLQDQALWLELLTDYPIYVMQERLTLYRKFFKQETNLSALSSTTQNRLKHENWYVLSNYIKTLPDDKFSYFLKEYFRDEHAAGTAELKCERAFILQSRNDLHCIDMFMELFEDEETRDILEHKYQFKLSDFYTLNAKSFSYDDEVCGLLLKANDMIHQCEMIIEEQKKIIQNQQQMLTNKE